MIFSKFAYKFQHLYRAYGTHFVKVRTLVRTRFSHPINTAAVHLLQRWGRKTGQAYRNTGNLSGGFWSGGGWDGREWGAGWREAIKPGACAGGSGAGGAHGSASARPSNAARSQCESRTIRKRGSAARWGRKKPDAEPEWGGVCACRAALWRVGPAPACMCLLPLARARSLLRGHASGEVAGKSTLRRVIHGAYAHSH